MNAPSWMKPHLRQRLEQERKEATRTGPVNGEKALVADEKGRIKEVVTDHKPLPPKDLPPLPPKNELAEEDAPELGSDFFDSCIVTKPGESIIDSVREARIKLAIERVALQGVERKPWCDIAKSLMHVKPADIAPPPKRFSWAELEKAFRPREAELRSVSYQQLKQWIAECKE